MNFLERLTNVAHLKRVLARAVACGLLLVLPSCRIPLLRPAEQGPDVPSNFNGATNGAIGETSSAENSALLGFDAFYNDPVLTRLIVQALDFNRELKILDQEVLIARNEVLSRQGSYLPFVRVGGSVEMDKSSRFTRDGAVDSALNIRPGQPIHNPLFNFATGINLFWLPDIWRELRNGRDAAAQRYVAAGERRNAFVTQLIAEIAENYYTLMALDQRIITLDNTIALQQQSYEIAVARKNAGRGTELAVQRFQAEVRRNQSEKLIVRQDIVEAENRINFRVNRFPAAVERASAGFFDLNIPLSVGVPADLLQNRPDIRRAERELAAAGLDVKVARARFFPSGSIRAGVGFEAFNPKYLFYPEAFVANAIGELSAPLINKKAIQADYLTASARQLSAVYDYQRVILNGFTEVINRVSMAENFRRSIEIKKQQLAALEAAVASASQLFQQVRVEYIEVLFAQRDLNEARTVLIETKQRQLSAVVNAYQALGGGGGLLPLPPPLPPRSHSVNRLTPDRLLR